jgi:signal peptidase II
VLLMLSVLGGVVALDQASKATVIARLQEGSATRGAIAGVRLRHVVNRRHPWRSSRGVLELSIGWLLLVPLGFAIASATEATWAHVALGAGLGGATGNLVDGVQRRAVTDFIDLRVWPVFNLADAAIVGGALLTGWHALRLLPVS